MTASEQKGAPPWSESAEAKVVIEMTRISENQLRMREDFGELKTMLNKVLNMQEDLLRHSESIRTLQEASKRMFDLLERHSDWQTKHEQRNIAEFEKVGQKIDEKLGDVWKFARGSSERLDAFRNKSLGALLVLSVLWTASSGGIYWAISTLVEGRATDRLVIQRIEHIEQQLGIAHPKREEK